MKRINNYLNFLNKTNGQTHTKKSTVSNILKRGEYIGRPKPSTCVHTARRIRSEAYACSAPTCRSLILWSIVCRRAGQVALSWPLIDRGDSQTHVRSIHGSMILFAAGLRAAADVRPPAGHLIALSLYSSRTRRARVTSRVCLHVLDRIRCIQLSACIAARRAEECRCWRFSYRNFFFNKKTYRLAVWKTCAWKTRGESWEPAVPNTPKACP
jgi:hypothetical protein